MTALTTVLANITESLGYGVYGGGTTAGATIYENHQPDAPAACLTIYQTGGPADTQDFSGNTEGEQSAQFRFRDPDPVALQSRILGLYALWTAWTAYPVYYVTLKAATKAMFNYPPEDSNAGNLFVASFNVRVIQGS